jgi:hypothetical protein
MINKGTEMDSLTKADKAHLSWKNTSNKTRDGYVTNVGFGFDLIEKLSVSEKMKVLGPVGKRVVKAKCGTTVKNVDEIARTYGHIYKGVAAKVRSVHGEGSVLTMPSSLKAGAEEGWTGWTGYKNDPAVLATAEKEMAVLLDEILKAN